MKERKDAMQDCIPGSDFETALAGERPRLVRLCAWLTGSGEAAEDLAQETLAAAWRSREQLACLDKLQPWTSAIARNICLNWSRGHRRERSYVISCLDDSEELLESGLPDETNIELELDRQELATLLDRALSLLPRETGQMLVEHYIRQSSHAEIAALMKLKPGTVAVRLQRGKLALQRYMQTLFKEEALTFGLNRQAADWVDTNIWCVCCGQVRLLGKFRKHEVFALRCPKCDPEPHGMMVGMDLTQPYYVKLLGKLRTYKPAYSRLLAALAPLYRRSLQGHTTPCPACGSAIEIQVQQGNASHIGTSDARQILLHCPDCGWASNKTASGLVMSMPEAQKFWREYPRMIILPGQEIEAHGARAFLTRIKSVTSAAELSVLSRHDTFEPLDVHTNIPL